MSPKPFFESILALWGAACAVAIGGPVALVIPGLEPPWPEGIAVAVAVVFSVVALIIGYAALSPAKLTTKISAAVQRRALWVGCAALLMGLLLCMAYLFSYSRFVVSDTKLEGDKEVVVRRVVGSELLDPGDARRPPVTLLRENSFDENLVWSGSSLTQARFLVLASFVGMFFFLSLGLSCLGMRFVGGNRVDAPAASGEVKLPATGGQS